MQHVTSLLLVCAFCAGALAETPESYRSSSGQFSFVLPSPWFPLPPAAVSDHQKALERQLGHPLHPLSMVLDTVLQKPSDQAFAPPCIQVQFLRHGGMMTEQVFKEKYGMSSGSEQIKGAAREAVRRGLVKAVKTGQPVYDPERHMALMRGQTAIAGIGKAETVSALFLGGEVMVLVNLLSTPETLEDHMGAFKQVIDTFQFDAGYAYRLAVAEAVPSKSGGREPGFWTQLLVDAGIYGTIAVVVILTGLLYSLIAKARKKENSTRE